MALGLPASAPANWSEPAPGSLNVDSTQAAFSPSVATVGGVVYVAWQESIGATPQIHVKQYSGGAWTAVGGALNIDSTKNAVHASIAIIGGTPYVAWSEYNGTNFQIHVKQFTGGAWTAVGGPLNVDATHNAYGPNITSVGGVPYVAWQESNGSHDQVYVKQFDGAAWTAVGGSLNVDSTKDAGGPSITNIGGVPYVAWSENNATNNQVYVKRFDGAAWTAVGGSLNVDSTKDAVSPSITSAGSVPYVAWKETNGTNNQVYVKQFDGAAWTSVGGSLNVDPTKNACDGPSATIIGTTPYVGWSETNGTAYQIRVASFRGGAWMAVGGSLNIDPTKSACDSTLSITSVGSVPYVAWNEPISSQFQIRAKRLEPDILAQTAAPTATGATLTAQVNDYGVPLPVGFELGAGSAFGTQTPLQSSPGSGVSTVTQMVSGLAPTTTYIYRAFGSDTFRETSRGPTQSFRTLALPLSVGHISGLLIAPSTFAAAPKGPTVLTAKRRAYGAALSYIDSQPATTTFTVQRRVAGRRAGHKCVKPSKHKRKRKHKRCTRYLSVGSFTHADAAGPNHFRFTGRVRGRKLKPAKYRLRATARNTAGAGPAAYAQFRIKR